MSEASATTVPVEKTPRKAWLILLVTYLASCMAPMLQFKIPPLASWIIPYFQMDGVLFGYCMSAVTIIGVILAFPAAFIARRIGLKATMLVSIACLGAGSAIGAFTDSLVVMMASRMVEGVGIGLIGVAAPTCVSVWFPLKTRGLALGIWATWVPLGMILAFNCAPIMAASWGFQSVFWIMAAACAVMFALFALVFTMPKGADAEAGISGTLRECVVFLKNKRLWVLGAIFFLFNAVAIGIVSTFYNTFLETELGLSPQFASMMAGIIMIPPILCAPLSGGLSDKLPINRKYVLVSITMVILLVDILFMFNTGPQAIIFMWIFVILSGVSGGFCAGTCRPLAPIVVGGSAVGATMSMAVLQFCQNLGTSVASPLFGYCYEAFGWQAAGWGLCIPATAICFVLSFFIFPRVKKAHAAKVEEIAERSEA